LYTFYSYLYNLEIISINIIEWLLIRLEGLDPKTGKFTSINEAHKKEKNQKPNYVGKIIFHKRNDKMHLKNQMIKPTIQL